MPGSTGLSAIRAASRVPVFGAFDNQLGNGVIGGRLIQVQRLASEAASVGASILRGEPVSDGWRIIRMSDPTYDWRELQRWRIDVDSLPPGSTIRFRPDSFWDLYAKWIVLVVAVVVGQSLLILSLLTQRRHRRKAEEVQARLSGKLISAHEDERRLIARELHDDLSQRLARLAIDVALVEQRPDEARATHAMNDVRSELRQVSRDVHDMSYRLHPAVLEDLGLKTALSAECERAATMADGKVVGELEDIPDNLGEDVALCLYRIAQEALHNAVKYADADNIELSSRQDGGHLVLKVSDDGMGFDVGNHTAGSGLGLLSMKERVKLVYGKLEIESAIGKGTTVKATVPLTRGGK